MTQKHLSLTAYLAAGRRIEYERTSINDDEYSDSWQSASVDGTWFNDDEPITQELNTLWYDDKLNLELLEETHIHERYLVLGVRSIT